MKVFENDCQRCGHAVAAHAYDGPRGGYPHTFPCMVCNCRAPSRAGACRYCEEPQASHFNGDCTIGKTSYRAEVLFQPATARGVAALISQVDLPAGGATQDFIEGMDYLANELNDWLEI